MKKVRVAVIGVGYLGRFHAQKYAQLEECELVAVVDGRQEARDAVAAEVAARGLADHRELLGQVDAVSIVTPTAAHFPIAREFLAAGAHVLVEKPITETPQQARELIRLAAQGGRILQVGHLERFNSAILGAEAELRAPRFIECHRLAPYKERGTDVSVVLDLMIHDIDLVRTLMPDRVVDVAAVGVPLLTSSVDIANARLTFASGAVANITASRVSKERLRKIRIFQPTGYLSLDLAAGTGEFYRLRRDVDLAALAREGRPIEIDAFVERVALDAPEGEPLKLELESFAAAVRGEQPVTVTGEDGRDALAIALRIVGEIERQLLVATA
jgi:predicted dehydrogenase